MYILYILLAAVLWFVMFVLKPFNFWAMMVFSTSLLSVISYIIDFWRVRFLVSVQGQG